MKCLAVALSGVALAAAILPGCGGASPRPAEPRGPRSPRAWPIAYEPRIGGLPAGWEGSSDAAWECVQGASEDAVFPVPPQGHDPLQAVWILRPNPPEHAPPADAFLFWTDHRIADGRLTVRARPVLKGGVTPWGVVVRAAGSQAAILVRVNPAERNLRIHKVATGEPRILAGRAVSQTSGSEKGFGGLLLAVEFRGNRITATLEGNPPLTADDEDAGEAGSVGLYAGGDRRVEFAGLEILELPGPPVQE